MMATWSTMPTGMIAARGGFRFGRGGCGGISTSREVVVAIDSDLAEAGDEMGVLAVRIELAGDEVAGTHPAAPGPPPERDASAGRPARGGHHLHPLERLLDAPRAQRVGVGEGVQQGGREVTIHQRHDPLRSPAVGGLELVEEGLADSVLLVVLV